MDGITRRPRHWLPRFSLRTLLIAVTVISVLISAAVSWYRAQEAEYLRQQHVEDRLRECWASVQWEQRVPVWLRWTGDWHVRRRIGCVNCSVGQLDSAITELKEISTDYELTAIDVDLTASAVDRMKELKGLRKLELYGSRSSMEPEASRENYIRTRTNALRRSLPGVEVSITIVDFT